ncbi:phage tail protein [Jiella avicenniae]|uniref:Phage tail protein n=1 Tax=Jiella avicenniae TaxID=2907202 RepID=A0A9X1T789_9HYPH|nr:phage tail protein [Jiella avicenniae]MCE7031017.1 phage tail protein [Jiella avicenniae]
MAIPTFTPPCSPSPGTSEKPEIKILRAQFGDGYAQATADGLNHIRRVVDLTWEVLDRTERDQIIAFLNERAGYKTFYYQMPHDNTPTRFVCSEWSDTAISGNFHRVTAVFRQDFGFSGA